MFAAVFATWFGAETVLGIAATFLREVLGGLVSDPFGAASFDISAILLSKAAKSQQSALV